MSITYWPKKPTVKAAASNTVDVGPARISARRPNAAAPNHSESISTR